MAFWLYAKNGSTYERIQSIKLTGKAGILARFLQSHASDDTPFTWELTPAALVELVDPSLDSASHEIVIDMLPEGLTEVSLYRMTSLRGSSEYDESDLVMAFKLLQQGPIAASANEFKNRFVCNTPPNGRQMVEAFHLTGGVATGSYYWSKPKMDIGAAICPATAKTSKIN
ncbi:hypothetical protein SH580_07765 [Coraliomargarita algicola]|uniref:Uncharacterized protein n=1 Tax=Coraliomargarita algicola TaxID=3092156 RepID=A0ABZ0RN02_9BACT|nr:hypothetical protein [Coraliomargarita sp. J2-16]WPJ97604.1 hypothetical protein SH580_07765 [Coraliomargarita sp. J2-16]